MAAPQWGLSRLLHIPSIDLNIKHDYQQCEHEHDEHEHDEHEHEEHEHDEHKHDELEHDEHYSL